MQSRRKPLRSYQSTQAAHAGLWFDKFAESLSRETTGEKAKLVREVAEDIKVPDCYVKFYDAWKAALGGYKQSGRAVVTGEAKVNGRMVVGTGNESVIETAVSLHKTYGVPYIPGSALKGLTATFARQFCGDEWSANREAYKLVFGNMDESGCVTFFDAYFIPSSNPQPLRRDVLTVHHQDYYNSSFLAPPADWDDPVPVPFLSATGSYLIALAAHANGGDAWLQSVIDLLKPALANVGIGAKTSSGYGRMELVVSDNRRV